MEGSDVCVHNRCFFKDCIWLACECMHSSYSSWTKPSHIPGHGIKYYCMLIFHAEVVHLTQIFPLTYLMVVKSWWFHFVICISVVQETLLTLKNPLNVLVMSPSPSMEILFYNVPLFFSVMMCHISFKWVRDPNSKKVCVCCNPFTKIAKTAWVMK